MILSMASCGVDMLPDDFKQLLRFRGVIGTLHGSDEGVGLAGPLGVTAGAASIKVEVHRVGFGIRKIREFVPEGAED
jgi:hypothetical protein